MIEEYLARAIHAERIAELDRERAVKDACRIVGHKRGPLLSRFIRRQAQPAASRASNAPRAAGQPVSSIE